MIKYFLTKPKLFQASKWSGSKLTQRWNAWTAVYVKGWLANMYYSHKYLVIPQFHCGIAQIKPYATLNVLFLIVQ